MLNDTPVPDTSDDEMKSLIFRAACLQCGTNTFQWHTNERLILEVGKRVGEMTRRFDALLPEEKIAGKKAIVEYLEKAGR